MTIREKILYFLEDWTFKGEWVTATEIALYVGEKLSSVSSLLKRMVDEGQLERRRGMGPRDGFGYRSRL